MPGTSLPALPPNRLVSSLTTNTSTVSSCCCDPDDALLAGLPGAAFRRTGVERAEPRANLVVSLARECSLSHGFQVKSVHAHSGSGEGWGLAG